MTLFLLGAASCFLYFVIAGIVADRLCGSDPEEIGGATFVFASVLWPLGLPYLVVRNVWR